MRIVGFLPTAFTGRDEIDVKAIGSLVEQYVRFGITPAVLGGMGEYYALNRTEARAVMEAAVSAANGQPVFAGVGFASREAALLAKDAAHVGVHGVIANPQYYVAPTPRGLEQHVQRLFDDSGLPVTVYSSADQPVTESHLEALTRVEGFHGVKEEHYDVSAAARRIEGWGDRIIWWGVGELNGMEYVKVGAQIVTSGFANVSPKLVVDYVGAVLNGEPYDDFVQVLRQWEYFLASTQEGAPSLLKSLMHICYGWEPSVRLPVLNPSRQMLEDARALVASLP